MKTRLLKKIRKRFSYKFEKTDKMKKYRTVISFNKKTNEVWDHFTISRFIEFATADLGMIMLAISDAPTKMRRRKKVFDSIK